ncbi:MAG: hypothetical protein OMM_05033 [Candidatus Magnetoglobus multicellularis str. Araruama]|uniref:NACHT domain-containing protein n=1 Tax=Candidatus Magnetoglobus multicellularis str. Araruama TaxID=890399 RepID=A0A1V1NYK8_9BACT|nr:MAG: hypothetical protein OMM_05033 [Candidatus Magnetoglobus multicellularis str. Araruama]
MNKFQAKIGTISWLSYFAIRAYRSHVKQTYGKVRNIYLDKDEILDLEQVFVPMTLILRKEETFTLTKRKETREILTDPDHRRLVILANPGSGKTTLFQALSSGVSSRQWHELDHMLPVFISLRKFSAQTDCSELFDWICQETFPFHGLNHHTELLKSLIAQGRILLLLDGLDEINENNEHQTLMAIENFINTWDHQKEGRIFVSCREQNFNMLKDPTIFIRLGFQEYRLSDLRDREMETLIANRRDDFEKHHKHIDRFMKDIRSHPNTLSLHRNPLLLTISIALYLYRPHEEVPHNLAAFYEESIRHLLRRRDYTAKDCQNAFNERDKYFVLQQFALSYMNKCTKENKDFETFPIKLMIQVAQKAAKERINVSPDQAEKLVIEIQTKAGLITDTGDTSHFTFAHRSFHEYCAARLLSVHGEKGLKMLKKNILNPKWHQTAIFYISIVSLEGNNHAEDLILYLLHQAETKPFSEKKEILWLIARCASELNHPLEQLRTRLIDLLFQTIQQAEGDSQELMVSLVIMGRNAPEAVRKTVEIRLQQLIDIQNPQSLAKELNRLDQETALALLKFMADSNTQSHHDAALIGLQEMDCLEKIEILWTLLEKFENQHNQQASTHARHQIFSVIEQDHEAVSYLNNLNTRCLSFLEDQDVVNIYPFCPPDTKPDNFARLIALEKKNQTTTVSDVVQLDKDHPWKSFFIPC